MTQSDIDVARRILDSSMYMTLATADRDGKPWASPVWFAAAGYTELFWASREDARHSQNLAARPEVAIVVFDSTVPVGGAEAVYLEARAEEVRGTDLEHAIAVYSQRSTEAGAPEWSAAEVSPPASLRLYRATVAHAFVLGEHDRRIAVHLDEDGSS